MPHPDETPSASGQSTVGVVIRALDEGELIGTCLERLHRQRGDFELDLLVVDSGSTDSTVEIARSLGARIVEICPSEFDYSTALNLGIDNVRGDIVVSLSAHAIPVDEHWLATMIAAFEEPSVAGVTCRQVPWPDAPWKEIERLRQAFGDARLVYGLADAAELVFSNAASGIRRSVWRDQPFTLPAVEDLEWARRVVSAGWTIVYEPRATVFHSHEESARAQARRLIDISRVHDGDAGGRTRRRTVRDAAGLLYRDSRSIVGLDEPVRRKLAYMGQLARTAYYYVSDFPQSGTTAERRRRLPGS